MRANRLMPRRAKTRGSVVFVLIGTRAALDLNR